MHAKGNMIEVLDLALNPLAQINTDGKYFMAGAEINKEFFMAAVGWDDIMMFDLKNYNRLG